MLWGATAAYTVYYFCRVNISIAIPFLQESLGASKTQLGVVASSLQVAYGTGKFVNGVLGDRMNPRYFMAAGLLLSGLANLIFGSTSALGLLAIVWALNGWFQSMGFPAGARLLSHYYPPREYGRSWSIFGCSHQVGAVVVLIAGGYLAMFGWRYVFWIPGLVAVAASAGVAMVLRDVPHKNKDLGVAVPEPQRPSLRAGLSRVLTNRYIWATAIGNLFLYIVRYGLLTWTASFLISSRGMTSVGAGWMLGTFEFMGLFGGLSAGWISDVKFHGRRGHVMSGYMVGLAASVACVWFAPQGNALFIGLALACCGFFVYGPLMMVSVAAAGYAGPELAGSASGVGGLCGYAGATLAGAGLGATAEHIGWGTVFAILILASLASALCFALTIPAPAPKGERELKDYDKNESATT